MTYDFTSMIERVDPKRITEREARERREELSVIASRPRYPRLDLDTIIYADVAGNYYLVERGRKS